MYGNMEYGQMLELKLVTSRPRFVLTIGLPIPPPILLGYLMLPILARLHAGWAGEQRGLTVRHPCIGLCSCLINAKVGFGKTVLAHWRDKYPDKPYVPLEDLTEFLCYHNYKTSKLEYGKPRNDL